MTVNELRRKYLDFFQSKGHTEHPSGSLVPYDVTGRLDESLLFNGAGMVQFKPYFRGIAEPPSKRLTTSQKCLRTGDIESVGNPSHLTFFEMLGNFSFGDYFKAEAIAYSWEFLTSPTWLGLDPKRLAFTVFLEDDVAYEEWFKHLSKIGIDPATRIFRLGEETNYWPAGAFSGGPPGPCGPNSEMFYWVSNDEAPPVGAYGVDDYVRDDKAGKWLEIWNDVFIQYEWQGSLRDPERPDKGYEKTGMPSLPFESVDTGMGIERTVTVLSGLASVYDTDAFQSIFRSIEITCPGLKYGQDPGQTVSMRVIADHLRAAVFCIGDGVLPSNTGRGYVLRRLIRRAVLKGARTLRIGELFMCTVAEAVIGTFGGHYVELVDRRETIVETLKQEEAQFRRTLEAGSEQLASFLASLTGNTLAGDTAFQLYDTFGFPLEVTQEICAEAGVEVDVEGYRAALAEAQERSRASSGMDTVYGAVAVVGFFVGDEAGPKLTEFVGYGPTASESTIVGALPLVEDGKVDREFVLALDRTPFYAESGGQVADLGTVSGQGFTLQVKDVTKQDGIYVHLVDPGATWADGLAEDQAQATLQEAYFNQSVTCSVDANRRADVTRNHTATHLLHAALRQVLGGHVTQAGSLVAPDHLRFDFTHGAAMSADEVKEVETLVNTQVLAAQPMVTYENVPIDQARQMGAMALFGEKYGDAVRVVQVGGMASSDPSWSRELCGGIHVRNTGEIGLFKILHEASAASGVRRIVAVTGAHSLAWVHDQHGLVNAAAARLKTTPKDLLPAIDKTLEALRDERKKREKLAQSGAGSVSEEFETGGVVLRIQRMTDAEQSEVKGAADRLVDGHAGAVAFVSNIAEGKVTFVCKVGDGALGAGVKAGDLVKVAATITGGGGGGRPDFATAGGRDASKLGDALEAVKELLGSITA